MAMACRKPAVVAASACKALSSAGIGRNIGRGSCTIVPAQTRSASSNISSIIAAARRGCGVDGFPSQSFGVPRTGRRLGSFRASSPRRDVHVMDLPGLGDSISEGTVVQWCKSVGDEVKEDEVIAVVETDKVSVEVRSTHVGVVVKLFAAVDDVVLVGKPLCSIDGDEASVVKAKIQAAQDEEDANAPPPEVRKPNLDDAFAGAFMAGADFVAPKRNRHEPLIKFVGKRALQRQQQSQQQQHQSQQSAADSAGPARHRHSPGALDFSQIVGGAMFGRPVMSEDEMEAINSGGADTAPQLRYIDGSRWAS